MLRTLPHSIVSHAVEFAIPTLQAGAMGLYECDSIVSETIRLSTLKNISRKTLLVACCIAQTRCLETHFSKSSSSRMCLVATKTMVLMGLLE